MRPETRLEGRHLKTAKCKEVSSKEVPCPKQEVKTRAVEGSRMLVAFRSS